MDENLNLIEFNGIQPPICMLLIEVTTISEKHNYAKMNTCYSNEFHGFDLFNINSSIIL